MDHPNFQSRNFGNHQHQQNLYPPTAAYCLNSGGPAGSNIYHQRSNGLYVPADYISASNSHNTHNGFNFPLRSAGRNSSSNHHQQQQQQQQQQQIFRNPSVLGFRQPNNNSAAAANNHYQNSASSSFNNQVYNNNSNNKGNHRGPNPNNAHNINGNNGKQNNRKENIKAVVENNNLSYSNKANNNNSKSQSSNSKSDNDDTHTQYRIFKRGDILNNATTTIATTSSTTINSSSSEKSSSSSSENSCKPVEGGISWDELPVEVGQSQNQSTENFQGNNKENRSVGVASSRKVTWGDNLTTSFPSTSSSIADDSQNQCQENNKSQNNNCRFMNRTSIGIIADLARFYKIQFEYKLVKEFGPAHSPTFIVNLELGDEKFEGRATSIKKAQIKAADEALENTKLQMPLIRNHARSQRNMTSVKKPNVVFLKLQAIAEELNESISYFNEPSQMAIAPQGYNNGNGNNRNSLVNVNVNNSNVPFVVHVAVGSREFKGEGTNYIGAKQQATINALKAMQKVKQELDYKKLEEAGLTPALLEEKTLEANNKSPISIVHEMAMKRSFTVSYKIFHESGPAHNKKFGMECKVGSYVAHGYGSKMQIAKKTSSEAMIEILKDVPISSAVSTMSFKSIQRALQNKTKGTRKKNSTPVVKEIEKEIVSPISRLIQIAHIKKYKEPIFNIIQQPSSADEEEDETAKQKQNNEKYKRGGKRRHTTFTFEVVVGPFSYQGSGPNKKDAKKAAANEALIKMGYPPSDITSTGKSNNNTGKDKEHSSRKKSHNNNQQQQSKDKNESKEVKKQLNDKGCENTKEQSSTNTNSLPGTNADNTNNTSSINTEQTNNVVSQNQQEDQSKFSSGRQIVPGVLVLQNTEKKETLPPLASAPSVLQKMIIATNSRFLLPDTSLDNIKKLSILADLFNLQITYSNFPKKNEFLSVCSLSTTPECVAYGVGKSLEEAQNLASLKILEECAEFGESSKNIEENATA